MSNSGLNGRGNAGEDAHNSALHYCHAGFAAFLAFGLAFLPPFYAPAVSQENVYVEPVAEKITQKRNTIPDQIAALEKLLQREHILYTPRVKEDAHILEEKTITFYNPVPEQTDGNPCEGAWTPHTGINFCKTHIPIVATRELDMGTIVRIDNLLYVVADKPHERYGSRFDILVNSEKNSMERGRKKTDVEVIGMLVSSR